MTDIPCCPASRHVSVWVQVSAAAAYEFASDPRNLPRWAAGLASSEVLEVGAAWAMSSPLGEVTVEFVPDNALGVLDHVVRLPDGQAFGMTDAEFDADSAAVRADLETLKRLLEN